MKDKIVLIDGHSILNRAFFGVPTMTNAKGVHTNAINGFLNILFKILEEEKPTHLTVAFDVKAPTFRHDMFKEYKGHRKPMQDELRQQVPIMKDVLRAMGVTIVEMAGFEADDLLGTIGKKGEAAGLDVSIISGDRDLLQLATEVVKIRIPKTKQGKTEIENYYAADVKERYEVTPVEFIDVKALMGDASDNIPGVPSVGEKTATKIIVEYGSIENAYAHVSELKPPRASKALEEHYDLAQISKTLATITTDVEMDYDLEGARMGELFTPEAYELYVELGFKRLLGRFDTVKKEAAPAMTMKAITSKSEGDMILGELAKLDVVGLALYKDETNALPLFAHLNEYTGLTLAVAGQPVFMFPSEIYGEFTTLVDSILEALSSVKTIAAFDIKSILSHVAIPQEKAFDSTVAAYLKNPLKNDYQALDVASEYLGLYLEPTSEASLKAAHEAMIAVLAYGPQKSALESEKMLELYETVEVPLIYTLYAMEQAGVKVEGGELKAYGDRLVGRIEELEASIHAESGETFNINSPKQLGVILFDKMELPHGKKTKTGYSTSADVLDKLAVEFPIVKDILEYRQLTKLKSTYADGLANYIGDDGRIHGKFNQTITATGRISSTEPNLQNIPMRTELGRLIRKVFVPESDYVFIDADYSQIELRILAHCSGDEQLIEAYAKGADIHRLTASQVFDTPFEEVSDLQRSNAKAVNFGIVYGISAFSLSDDLGVSRAEAKDYIERYFATYPKIKGFLDEAVALGKEAGYVETIFGRRRPVPELNSSNFMQRGFGERVAMNAPIQGAAADIMKIAMNNVYKALVEGNMQSRLVLQVHDELLVEAHKDEVEAVKEIIRVGMEEAAQLSVKLEIDMHEGENWYEAK